VIHHVAVEVPYDRVDACVAFWALLGFDEVAPPETLRHRARWVEREGTQVHLLWTDDPVVPASGHVAVVAPDHDAAAARLREAGFEPDERTQHWGQPRFVVLDPVGHRVEVMAAPPVPAGADG
jgi:catechol 2,3-dioxygenase-like lactoylglutathione lyase family enzyme